MISAQSIEILADLTRPEYQGQLYDLHGMLHFGKISFDNGVLTMTFQDNPAANKLSLIFHTVTLHRFTFMNTTDEFTWTLDLLYRGRVEVGGKLIELSEDGRGYFYCDFLEGQTVEFWAAGMEVKVG
ncbi:hypothetical protein [Dawidia soli]|uniref:Uncharacterized protein n=1 Tax=Dawidia soli TaxID=2782352 RepID=A0AAP2D602_9BACT|nr:hypothetical protein [Dawidia soli]MBT1685742.1 hypothetical protein [Dawidia soli]